MNFPVLKGTSYVLVHAPDMIIQNGTTQTTEKALNPDSEYLKEIPKHIRKYEEVLNYLPNQVYIGNKRPEDLKNVPQPWSDADKYLSGAERDGKYGEIMPEHEFIGLMKICDAFDLVYLNKEFTESDLEKHPLIGDGLVARLKEGVDQSVLEGHMENHAEGLYFEDKLVGVVTRAHDVDVNLSAHVMLENLVTKASG